MPLSYELIQVNNGQAVVSSRQIADSFGKCHDHVLTGIDGISKDVPNFGEMFYESTEPDAYGRQQRVFFMNRDGFTLVAMGKLFGQLREFWVLPKVARLPCS